MLPWEWIVKLVTVAGDVIVKIIKAIKKRCSHKEHLEKNKEPKKESNKGKVEI